MAEVFLISEPLLTEEIVDGPRAGCMKIMRDLVLSVNGEACIIPADFDTDYTSWPSFLPRPRWSRMIVAGVCHDYFYRYARLGKNGRQLGYSESNKLWRIIAGAGHNNKMSLGFAWRWLGWSGLAAGGWIQWKKYRNAAGN